VKNSKVHAILGELYRLLSQYTPAEFTTAANYTGLSDGMRAALLALAREAGQSNRESPSDAARAGHSRQTLGRNREPSVGHSVTRDGIFDMIRKSPRFSSFRAILEFAKELGLSVQARPKDGKDRLARRLAEAIESTSEPRRSQVLAALDRERESQTQGWIGVIKNNRP
jgi:hypothetical protein